MYSERGSRGAAPPRHHAKTAHLTPGKQLLANVLQGGAFVLILVQNFIWLYTILVLYGGVQTPWLALSNSLLINLLTLGYMLVTRQFVWVLGAMFGISTNVVIAMLKIAEVSGIAATRAI